MPRVNYLDSAGATHTVEVASGASLMEGAVQHGVPGVLGECGGNLSCATCHVYIDAPFFERVGPANQGSFEDEMLDNVSADRLPSSRLSCQVLMRDDLNGITVRIAPRQT